MNQDTVTHRLGAPFRSLLARGEQMYARMPDWAQVVVRVAPLMATLTVLNRLLLRTAALPAESYEGPVLLIELARHLMRPSLATGLLLAFIGGLLVLAVWTRSLGPSWGGLPYGRRFRVLAVLVAGLLAWTFATYTHNAYFGQSHLIDRLLLIVLMGLVAWRPAFIWAFLLVLLPIFGQFALPIGGASYMEPMLLVRVLLLLGVASLGRSLGLRVRGADVIFLIVVLIAIPYWASGLGKLTLENWLVDDRPYYLLYAAHSNGWLSHVTPARVDQFAQVLAAGNWPVKLFTLAVECGAILALTRRGVLQSFLVGCVVLHTGIFFTSGFFFWRWMALDVAVLLLFASSKRVELPIFTPVYVVLSVLLILGGPRWLRTGALAWRDAPMNYTYRFEAEVTDGTRYSLPPRFFEPYGYQFTLASFLYLVEEPRLDIVAGAATGKTVAQLADVRTLDDVVRVEEEHGQVRYNSDRAEQFDAFLRRFIQKRATREFSPIKTYLQAPPLLWSSPYHPVLPDGVEIDRIVMTNVTALYTGDRYREIRSVPIRVVELKTPADEAPSSAHRP